MNVTVKISPVRIALAVACLPVLWVGAFAVLLLLSLALEEVKFRFAAPYVRAALALVPKTGRGNPATATQPA